MANWASAIGNIFTGGLVKSVENISLEWIETNIEKAEAQAVVVKALDPNGKMRRDTMKFVTRAYGGYLILAAFLILGGSFSLLDEMATADAFTLITQTFTPVTSLFGVLATASFGVNANNVLQERKQNKYTTGQ